MDRPPRLSLAAFFLGASAIACALVLARASATVFRIRHAENRITVTGSATKRIRSDLAVWRAVVRSRGAELAPSYRKLATDVPEVVAFVKKAGIPDGAIKVSAVTVEETHPRDKDGHQIDDVVSGYVTTQTVEVSSAEIEKVEKISREATELIEKGVYVTSDAPLYLYTKLGELKVQMLADASKDAKNRAQMIASNAGSSLGDLIVARMGVMQVNAVYSTDVSAEGNNDKSSLEKDALAIVTASYATK